MAMNTNTLCLVSTMDRLWYHQIILWSDPLSSHIPNFLNTSSFHFTNFPSSPSPSPLPFSPLMDQSILPSSSPSPSVSSDNISLVSQDYYSNDEDKNKQDGKKEPSEESLNNLKLSVGTKLNKSTSCKSLGELELEEVKGFMDLGFEFKKENLSPRMVKLLPGLQRLRTDQINKQNLEEEDDDDDDENDDDKKRDIARPYLSEAWTIKRSNSPLLNLRMPKVSSTSDMKKHLKSWAKTVAFEIQ
ncbi:uncharacterized protein LOC120090009 isoform X1 [Benincasa hispida]|uniref:uncharacterized protein LOC120090009 isoform X1 n=1 Tax=Benincasa hispida TaxID=102211 RepID=UPI0018FF7016|nr:uncharacterized protein LOC120090009 isoform X1 [Benincasa hispida]